MANALRDDNHKPTMLAVQDDGTVTLGKIDDTTDRLLMEIQHVASLPAPATQTIQQDDNHVNTVGLVDSNGAVKAMLINNADGGIPATVTIE